MRLNGEPDDDNRRSGYSRAYGPVRYISKVICRYAMRYENITKTELRQQAEGYVRAIQWNLHYYYRGCVSWNWFYPHHYAPYITDVVDFSDMDLSFELGEPFKPFEQLLAVLPAASAECLPHCLRELMCSSESPIAEFYPTDFRTDLNGKKNDWEAVVLIPFIDEKKLLSAMENKICLLTQEEKTRNSPGEILLFASFEASRPVPLPIDSFHMDPQKVTWGLLPNVKLDVYFPGFPTMKHLPHHAALKQVNVKVFQQESKHPSMVLAVKKREEFEKDMLLVARDILGKEVCIDWPILKMGVVDSLWASGNKYTPNELGDVNEVVLSQEEKDVMESILYSEKERMLSRYAIDIKNAAAVVFVRRFIGITYEVEDGVLRPKKQFAGSNALVPVALPLLVTDVTVENGKKLNDIPIAEAYPKHSKVFAMLPSWEGYGYPALVDAVDNDGRVRLTVSIWPTMEIGPILESYEKLSLQWMSSYDAGRRIGVDGRLLSRITGTVYLLHDRSPEKEGETTPPERINIGLALKLSKRNLEVADYTRRLENGYWQYSLLCVQLLSSYRNKFRDLFTFLEKSHTPDDAYLASDVWENETRREERVSELKEFLATVPTCGAEKQEGGTQYVDRLVVGHIENAIKQVPKKRWGFRKCAINPSVLYRAELYNGKSCADPDADFMLLDRVVYTLQGTAVPFGSQGTVVGLTSNSVEVLFDHEFNNGYKIRGAMNSGARVSKLSLINITYGKTRKGRSVEVTENLKKRRDSYNNRRKKEQRISAGRDSYSKSKNSVTPCRPPGDITPSAPPSEIKKILTKAGITQRSAPNNDTLSGSSSKAGYSSPQGGVISKEAVEGELARVLGLKKDAAPSARDEDAADLEKGRVAILKLLHPAPQKKHVGLMVSSDQQSSGAGDITAFNKLFPANRVEIHQETLNKLFPTNPIQKVERPINNIAVVNALSIPPNKPEVVNNVKTPPNRGARGGFNQRNPQRGRMAYSQRGMPGVLPAQVTHVLPPRPNFFGPVVQPFNDPKLTDLKPSSVVLPRSTRPRRRRGGKQGTSLTSPIPCNNEEHSAAGVAPPAAPPRSFASSQAHRVRKSRLAPKFTDAN
ncbi:hypothetical protein Q1695_011549 [Nippostrongylus brasiliensis]|nr:hypothetical protein Q1695_011549 [Nippostrongylus brasiliensis]